MDGSGSSDPDAGDVLTYDWAVYDKADGVVLSSTGPIYTIQYAELTAGMTYTVRAFSCQQQSSCSTVRGLLGWGMGCEKSQPQ